MGVEKFDDNVDFENWGGIIFIFFHEVDLVVVSASIYVHEW